MAKNFSISHKTSTVPGKAPLPSDLERGELAVNLADRKLFTKDQSDAVIELGGGGLLIADTPPPVEDKKFWWDSSAGQLYVGYKDANSTQWVACGGPPGKDADISKLVQKAGDTMAGPLLLAPAATPLAADDSDKVPSTGWVRSVTKRYPNLVLNVDPSGSVAPVNPIGDEQGSGDAFNTITAALDFLDRRVSAAGAELRIAPGTYTEAAPIDIHGVDRIAFSSPGAVTLEAPSWRVTAAVAIKSGDFRFKATAVEGLEFAGNFSVGPSNDVIIEAASPTPAEGPVVIRSNLGIPPGRTLKVVVATPISDRAALWLYDPYYHEGTLEVTTNGTVALTVQGGTAFWYAGKISTPGTAKAIDIAVGVAYNGPSAANLLNGAQLRFQLAERTTSGYTTAPDTGIITQWGSATTDQFGDASLSFPITYPNAVLFAGAVLTSLDHSAAFSTLSLRNAGVTFKAWSSYNGTGGNPNDFTMRAGLTVNWLAIGF